MKDYRKILVPTDFSTYAHDAGVLAVELAIKLDASVLFYHLVELPPGWETMSGDEKLSYPEVLALIERIKNEFNKLQAEFDNKGVEISTDYKNANLGIGFIDLMNDRSFDLIIMGSHGLTNPKSLMMGSNAQRVVRHAHCPVIVIKEPVETVRFRNIIFASNFNMEARKAFKLIVAFARIFKSQIHLLTINAPTFFHPPRFITRSSMQEFKRLATDVPCHIHDIPDVSVEKGIIKFSEEIDADLIAIGTYGRNAVSRIFIGSITEALVNHIQIPIMTINIHD